MKKRIQTHSTMSALFGVCAILYACGDELGMEEREASSISSSLVGRGDTLRTNQSLRAGEFLEVGRGDRFRHARLIVQNDANVVLRRERDDRVLWDTETGGNGDGARLTMQDDCNLVLRSRSGRVLWQSFTGGEGSDCRLVMFNFQGEDIINEGTPNEQRFIFDGVAGQIRRGDVREKQIFSRALN